MLVMWQEMELMVARKFWVKLKDIGVLEMEEIY